MLPCHRSDIVGISGDVLARAMDGERQKRFVRAVQLCLRRFTSDRGFSPRVLVVGCDAGDLCEAALAEGAEFVLGVEPNADLRANTQTALRAAGHEESTKFELTADLEGVEESAYDVGVFNLVDAVIFAPPRVARHVRCFDGHHRMYVVPQRVEQFFRDVTFDGLIEGAGPRRACFDAAIPEAQGPTLQLFNTREVPIHFHDLPHTSMLPRTSLYTWDATTDREIYECAVKSGGRATVDGVACSDSTFLVWEWVARLWDDVELQNTLEAHESLAPRDCVYRTHGCGIAMARLNRRAWSSAMFLDWTSSQRGVSASVTKNKATAKSVLATKKATNVERRNKVLSAYEQPRG